MDVYVRDEVVDIEQNTIHYTVEELKIFRTRHKQSKLVQFVTSCQKDKGYSHAEQILALLGPGKLVRHQLLLWDCILFLCPEIVGAPPHGFCITNLAVNIINFISI
jgi:hypothetical protein